MHRLRSRLGPGAVQVGCGTTRQLTGLWKVEKLVYLQSSEHRWKSFSLHFVESVPGPKKKKTTLGKGRPHARH